MAKRFFDILVSGLGILVLSPILILIAFLIKLNDSGDVLYLQKRVGQFGSEFKIFKFRTMIPNADKFGSLTIGDKDNRITSIGKILRKTKLDELPQLINVLIGNMSLVGPRPEVKEYVKLYSKEQKDILKHKPGITDYASIYYRNESSILGSSDNPKKKYIEEIMPHKITLNKKYFENASVFEDIKVIFLTIKEVITN